MDKPKITAKDFFLWAGAVVSLYWSIIAYTMLVFDYINYAFPNALRSYPADPYQSGISFEMASIIVLLPIFVLLRWVIHKSVERDPSRREIWVRRWALILTLFLAGIAMAADLITLLTTFLNGEEISTNFLLKVGVILLVAAGVFMHFISDLWGYWEQYPARKRAVTVGVVVLALATIGAGFVVVGTPGEARKARFDDQRVSDLQTIQSQVIYYWQAKRALPSSLVEVNASASYEALPTTDSETGVPYEYRATGALSFELCAAFTLPSREERTPRAVPMVAGREVSKDANWNWQHGVGRTCFSRTIDPSFYPPLQKM
jgi:hypothetical protein